MKGIHIRPHLPRPVPCALILTAACLAVSISSGALALATTGAVAGATTTRTNAVATAASVQTDAASVSITLTSITPEVSTPKAPVTITGTVRNTSTVQIDRPVARVLIGHHGLATREAVEEWAATDVAHASAQVVRSPLGSSMAPGAVRNFSLLLPAASISHGESFAALPVSVDLLGTTPVAGGVLGSRHTFLPSLSAIKRYEPVSVAWLVPLTLDPDPALQGMDSPARTAAWTRAIGTGSRLDRLITGTDTTKVTWAIDPAILGPPPVTTPVAPSTSPSTSPAPTTGPPGGTAPTDPVALATRALARRLREAAPRHTLLSLPYADPDLGALLPLASARSTLPALITHPSPLNAAVGATRADIAWLADGTLSSDREKRLRQAFTLPRLAGAITAARATGARSGYTDDASRKSSGGLPLLCYDPALSTTFAQTSVKASAVISTQRFLADSLALLGERPGTPDRSILIAAPRAFAPDPGVLATFFAAIAKAPWLTPRTTDQLLAASEAAPPDQRAAGAPTPSTASATSSSTSAPTSPSTSATASPSTPLPSVPTKTPDPLDPGPSQLTATNFRSISATRTAITGIASIRDDAELFRVRWTDAQDQLVSTRWRSNPRGIAVINAATDAAVTSVSRGVRVVPSSVNFFADRGMLQITVVNDLSVPVHDVHLILTPDQPRLHIDRQPAALRIGAKSRTTVPLEVTAIAAGVVPIEAVLTTPNGTPLGQNATVNVRVQPTSTWMYWVLGGLAGVILLLGIYRSLRRGSTRASRPAALEITTDD